MPYSGGWNPSPLRYGSGEGASDNPLLERVFQSIAAQRGTAYDQTTQSIVGVENMAYARAITFDGWGTNRRLVNGFFPATMTASSGMLQRWERIFGLAPLPTDTESVRRGRVAAAWSKIGNPNSIQPVIDALTAALGPLFVGVTHVTLQNSVNYINGVSQTIVAGPHAGAEPTVTISGTPVDSYSFILTMATGGAVGTATFNWSSDGGRTTAASGVATASSVALGATGMSAAFSPGTYFSGDTFSCLTSPGVPWMSTLAHLQIALTYLVAGYQNTDGSPNAAFYAAAASINPILDSLMPAWASWDWYVNDSAGTIGFLLDELNIDLEAFDS